MVYTDNKVALRQLEAANKLVLNHTSLRSYEGKSIAKDGKFHPRVLTLVRIHQNRWCATKTLRKYDRVVIIRSLGRSCAESMTSTGLSGNANRQSVPLLYLSRITVSYTSIVISVRPEALYDIASMRC